MTAEQATNYIFEHMGEFEAEYAGVIAKFESKGIEPKMAKALAITIAANAKAVADATKAA